MKIAHVITRMIVGGAQENTLFTCQDLISEHGEDVLLITGPALGPEGDLLEKLRGTGPDVPTAMTPSLRRAIRPGRDIAAYREVRRELQRFQPDVVHTHSAKAGFLGRLAAWSLKTPAIVHTIHGAPFYPYQNAIVRNLYRWLEWHAARKCHKLVSVADAMTDLMVQGRVAQPEKFVTIHSGMDVEPFLTSDAHRAEARASLQLDDDDIVVGKVARLFHLKGHEFLIEAAAEAVRRAPQLKFLLVGDGILRDELTQQIQKLGLDGHFRFTGLAPPSEIPKWISAMDILAHTSLREGLARALPQALISAKPAISYDIDGAREVVLDRVTGRLLKPRAVGPLADAMVELAEEPQLRKKWGEEGRRRFTDQFRRQTMARRLHELYTQLLQHA